MNINALIAAGFVIVSTVIHLTKNVKYYLIPLQKSDFDAAVRIMFYWLFHTVTIFKFCSITTLIYVGVEGADIKFDPILVLGFIGTMYLIGTFSLIGANYRIMLDGEKVNKNQWIIWTFITAFVFLSMKYA